MDNFLAQERHDGTSSRVDDMMHVVFDPTALQPAHSSSQDREGQEQNRSEPAWKEMKTKAGKERKRLPLACINCRRKKIKCSGEKPSCRHCLRSQQPCIYKGAQRKPAPRTDYMVMLDRRLKRMEERVIRSIPRDEQGQLMNATRAIVKPAIMSPGSGRSSQKKRDAEQAFGRKEIDEWAHKPPIATSQHDIRPPKSLSADEASLFTDGSEELPPKEIQEHLAEVFFDYVYGQAYFLLHKPSYMRKLHTGQLPPVLILAVCAISARFSNHPSLRTEPTFLRGEEWASTAREIALKRYDKPNITILITYLILGLHEFGTCQGGRSWMFGGMAQRMAFALQLHKELDYETWGHDEEGRPQQPKLSPTDREIRRRTMWSCYMMDRFTSSGTDRPLFLEEKHIMLQLPIKESMFSKEIFGVTESIGSGDTSATALDVDTAAAAKQNTGIAGYTVRAVAVWGRIIRFQTSSGTGAEKRPMWLPDSTFNHILKDAQALKDSIPDWLAYTPENLSSFASEKISNQFIFLHIFIHQNILFLNQFAITSNTLNDSPKEFLHSTMRAALKAANAVSELLVDAMDHRVVAPFAGYCAFLSGTIHVHSAFSTDKRLEARSKKNLAINIRFISKIKNYYGMFHFVMEQLKDLYRFRASRSRPASAGSNAPAEKPVFQYGDWFDRYPSGVSPTEYESPGADGNRQAKIDRVVAQKSSYQAVSGSADAVDTASKVAVAAAANVTPAPPTVTTSNLPAPDQPKKAPQRKKRASQHQVVKPQASKSQGFESNAEAHLSPGTLPVRQPIAQVENIRQSPALDTSQTASPVNPIFGNTEFLPQAGPNNVANPQIDWAEVLAAQQPLFQAGSNASTQQPDAFRMLSDLDKQMVSSGFAGYSGWGALGNVVSVDNTNQRQGEQQQTQTSLVAQAYGSPRQQQQQRTQGQAQQSAPMMSALDGTASSQEWPPDANMAWDNATLSAFDMNMMPYNAFPPGMKDVGFGLGGAGAGQDPGAGSMGPWFMPFNLQPPDMSGAGGVGPGAAGGGGGGRGFDVGMWDYMSSGLEGMDIAGQVGDAGVDIDSNMMTEAG